MLAAFDSNQTANIIERFTKKLNQISNNWHEFCNLSINDNQSFDNVKLLPNQISNFKKVDNFLQIELKKICHQSNLTI